MDFSMTTCLVLTTAACLLGGAASNPVDFSQGAVDVGQVVNRTTCPVVVAVDHDENRIPKRIKTFKCAQDPLEHCKANGVPESECCHSARVDVRMGCVELQDVVLVRYAAGERPLTVPVGCACAADAAPLVAAAAPE